MNQDLNPFSKASPEQIPANLKSKVYNYRNKYPNEYLW